MDLNNGTAAPADYRILLPASFSVCGGGCPAGFRLDFCLFLYFYKYNI